MIRLQFLVGLTVLCLTNSAFVGAPNRDIEKLLSQFSIVGLSHANGKVEFLKTPNVIRPADLASISSFFSEKGKQLEGCACFHNVRSGAMIFVKLQKTILIEYRGEKFETNADELSSRLKKKNEKK